MSVRKKAAVIGLGHQALEDHVPGLADSQFAQLAAVCDTDPTKVAAQAQQHNFSKSGKKTRQFNFTATTTHESDTVKLTEHDAHLWADRTEQERVSSAVRSVLATWHEEAA